MAQTNLSELKKHYKKLYNILESCTLCPRHCKINRLKGETGYCGATAELEISSVYPHFGEEPELVGRGGSGTVFLTHCNLKCLFCQNYDISHLGEGRITSPKDLAKEIINLKKIGCHNINFVTPTHYVPQIVEAIIYAKEQGLDLPLVFNCGGYESLEVIKLLYGIFDIYMPDIKFASPDLSRKYCNVGNVKKDDFNADIRISNADTRILKDVNLRPSVCNMRESALNNNSPDSFDVVKEVVKEMHRQVGDLVVENGIAKRGLLIRHLVMPNLIEDSKKILDFIANEISKDSYVNIMDQYRPMYKSAEFPEINRRITSQEYNSVVGYAKKIGLQLKG